MLALKNVLVDYIPVEFFPLHDSQIVSVENFEKDFFALVDNSTGKYFEISKNVYYFLYEHLEESKKIENVYVECFSKECSIITTKEGKKIFCDKHINFNKKESK